MKNLRTALLVLLTLSLVTQPRYVRAADAPVTKKASAHIPSVEPGQVDNSTLINLDVGGERGKDGAHGRDYSGSSSSGSGRNGGDATPATDGEAAGEIRIQMKNGLSDTNPKEAAVIIDGYVVSSKNAKGAVSQKIVIGDHGYLYLKAHGGGAGDGGNAGGGEGGGPGSDGSDATRYSTGGNGGPGYSGGNAGNPTDGGGGGKGGKITVEVPEDETELLMLVHEDVDGGNGGKKGRTASGGSGGRGGRGGSSYSWQESETTTSTDSNGNTTSNTTYTNHSNSGGSDGSSGSSGNGSSYNAKDGKTGDQGKFTIKVNKKDGTSQEYAKRYDMQLVDYEIDSDNHDGIFEPGEKASVKKIRVKNTGDMPTPMNKEVQVYLKNKEWVISDGQNLVVPKVLQPGEEYVFEKEDLNFKVKDTNLVGEGKRLVKEDQIRPLSFVTGVERHFDQFDNVKPFQITYPVEVTPIDAMQSLAPGESTRIMWQVKNISGKDFGSASDLKRQIAFDFKTDGGDISHAQIQMVDAKGKAVDMKDGLFDQIAHLKAGASATIEGNIGIKAEVSPYSRTNLATTLHIGNIDQPDVTRTIQKNNITITTAKVYQKSEGSGMLLVTNHNTTKEEIAAWEKLAKDMNSKVDIWDLSYEGNLDLGKALKTGSTIADDFKGKTIVMLNNGFNDSKGATKAMNYLTQDNFVHAAADRGIKVYSVGENAGERFQDLFMPTGAKGVQKASSKVMLKDLVQSGKTDGGQLAEGALKEFEYADYNRWTLFGKAKKTRLDQEASRIQSTLSKVFPDRRYVVVQDFEPKLVDQKLWGAFKKWDYGHLEVRRTLDAADRSLIALNTSNDALHTAKFVLSRENRMGLISAESFTDKLNLLKTTTDKETQAVLSDAISLELAQEQTLLRSRSWSTRSSASLQEAMPKLKEFADFKAPRTAEIDAVLEDILVKQRALNGSQWKWWEKIVPFRNNAKVSTASNRLLDQMTKGYFEGDRSAVNKKVDAEVKKLVASADVKRDPVKWAMYPESRTKDLQTDFEVLKNPTERTMEDSAFAAYDKAASKFGKSVAESIVDNVERRNCIVGVLNAVP